MDRVKVLEKEIKRHKSLYYQGKPEISDAQYDQLEDELKGLDPQNPVLEIIGAGVTGNNKVKHDTKMLSLNKTYKIEELISWKDSYEIVSTYKIDGISCSLIYENGKLALSKTRGDGSFGENITNKVIWIDSIPSTISLNGKVEVRGEIYCTEEDFFHLSDEMISRGLEKPTSQRNIVAGLIGRKTDLDLCRYLSFKAFDLISDQATYKTEMEKNSSIAKQGFEIPYLFLHKDKKDIEKRLEDTKLFMSEGEYQIDGIVFSYNDLSLHEELGNTAHHPRYKMAFKFQGESKETTLNDILWNVSRNGTLTPVGIVEPVELSGAKISRVTLHNYGLVKQYELKKGDVIEIVRSGEVIPKFISVVKSSEAVQEFPDKCPSCDQKIYIDDIRLKCRNTSCPAQVKEEILNFVAKIGIDDISSKRIDEMLNSKLISNISDLYKVKKEQFLELDKVKEKLATKFVEGIEKSKQVDLITFLSALGISGGAYNKCEKVVQAGYDNIDKILKLDLYQLVDIEGFAEKSAEEFLNSLRSKHELIKELIKSGFSFEKKQTAQTVLTGKKICITGSLSMKRSEMETILRDAGAIMVSSVTKNTDYLVTNDTESSSSKFKKAEKLEIPILNEDKLKGMIGDF